MSPMMTHHDYCILTVLQSQKDCRSHRTPYLLGKLAMPVTAIKYLDGFQKQHCAKFAKLPMSNLGWKGAIKSTIWKEVL